MSEEKKYKLKIYLAKYRDDENYNPLDLLKYKEDEDYFPDPIELNDLEKTKLFYKCSFPRTPSWYKDYLGIEDNLIKVAYGKALFFRELIVKNRKYVFAVTFSGADSCLAKENFEPRFGMKLALNVAKNIYSVAKSKVSGTQSKVRENATRGQGFSEFTFDFERDLLNGVVVYPKEDFSFIVGKIYGKDSVSFTTTYNFSELDELLDWCLKTYEKNDYKEDYSFIDNILEVPYQDPVTQQIYAEIFKAYLQKDYSRIWFAPAEYIEWEEVNDYGFYKSRMTKNTNLHIEYELDTDTVNNYISTEGIVISEISDFKKNHVVVRNDNENQIDVWKLFNCVYASVEVHNNQYVLNNGNIYRIDKDYYNDYEKKYRELRITKPLDSSIKNQKESEYNKSICEKYPRKYTLLDQKLVYHKNRRFEICDIFDNESMTFIHIKKYGQSSKLSHLFAQANMSSTLLKDKEFRNEIIKTMLNNNYNEKYKKISYKNTSIAIAIITNKEIPKDGYIEIPFFSKVNAVMTMNMMKNNLGYENVELMFIPTK